MKPTDTLLAAFEPLPQWLNFKIMFAALFCAGLGSLLWFLLFRRKKRRRKRKHHNGEELKLNSTLAESGGLPPAREEKSASGQPPSP